MNLPVSLRRPGVAIALGILVGACAATPGLAEVRAAPSPGHPTFGAAQIQFIRGDANDDGEISLGDVLHVAVYLYGAGPAPLPSPESGDANCDNTVGPLDVVYLINFILRGGPQPKCPT